MNERATELYNDGYNYYYGEDDHPLNYDMAFQRFYEAAQLSFGPAMNYLGVMYEEGVGVAVDMKAAYEWFSRAANANDSKGNYNVGRFYYQGTYVEQDIEKALDYFRKSYEIKANPHAAYPIAYNHMQNGEYSSAAPLFKYAAEETNAAEAWHNVGKCVMLQRDAENGDYEAYAGVAADYFLKAANLDYAPSMYEYAAILLKIYGQSQMKGEARDWMKRAADAGYEPAINHMKFFKAYSFFDRFS